MSKSAPASQKKRKLEDGMRGKIARPKKRVRKQRAYHSSSEDDDDEVESGFAPVNLNESDEETSSKPTAQSKSPKKQQKKLPPVVQADESEDEAEAEAQSDSEATGEDYDNENSDLAEEGSKRPRHVSKRNDPEAFSTSISKILSTKLSQTARKDPVLSRSRDAVETSTSLANERLEQRARAKLRAEKKEDLQRGRIKDVLGLSTGQTGEVAEEEKRLRKVAQRGVVKLFNAVRAAQVKGEQAMREERKKGTIGQANREEKVNEMSKQGFLELISGKKVVAEGRA